VLGGIRNLSQALQSEGISEFHFQINSLRVHLRYHPIKSQIQVYDPHDIKNQESKGRRHTGFRNIRGYELCNTVRSGFILFLSLPFQEGKLKSLHINIIIVIIQITL